MAAPSDHGDDSYQGVQSDDPALMSSGAEVRHDASTYLHNFLPGPRTCDGVMKYAAQTIRRMKEHEVLGYEIIEGNNPDLPYAKKWKGHECVRLARTNSKRHGWCIRTVWAVRKK